ncbi:putative tRNA(Ile)-lysidine synthase [Lachnellula suecica]|uniref:tRNA(Ile)-lysidine synthetase n=1 Tax=Lachnellula suecica TaxID=602035 RepID=A0A8T9CGP5_9HELO|nr:putative tRNA(Ile)-lysidine synthase [Lachnellula suecica]
MEWVSPIVPWMLLLRQLGHLPLRSLAISGGVDSMALAILCSRVQSDYTDIHQTTSFKRRGSPLEHLRKVDFRAFVVDHGVRTGSALEAQAVAKVLEAKGIQTTILKIEWPAYEKPGEMPNFESLARKYRYQVIGRACREHGINSLLLAHHEDDQAETVMMRLIGGHKRLGLTGMKTNSEIPECYGIHGVHGSGGVSDSPATPSPWDVQRRSQLTIETGGIRIYRPFIEFKKERLIATCQAEGMEWFEDKTNKDPTLTARNAIRHIYKSHKMPAALTKPALLGISRRCQAMADLQRLETEKCLSQCSIRRFDTGSGVLNVRFKYMSDTTSAVGANSKEIAGNVLRSIIMLVTPQEHVQTSSLHDSLKRVFPELYTSQSPASRPTAFTVAGVQFRPDIKDGNVTSPKKMEWLVSRQPHVTSIASPSIHIGTSKDVSWSEWALFDGRYWIRILNSSGESLIVRPFGHRDYDEFRHTLSKPTRRALHELLKDIAPGNIRFTLPSIVQRGEDGKEKVLALPTLGFCTPESKALVRWKVRYKKLYTAGMLIDSVTMSKS